MDTDFREWCDDSRLSRFRTEISPLVDTLSWDDSLGRISLLWVRRELAIELYNNNFLSSEERSKLIINARSLWDSKHSESCDPPCNSNEVEIWHISDILLLEWARAQFSHRLESLYLANKDHLDKITFSMIRVKDQFLAFELYQRIKSNESTLEQLSWKYGMGPERRQGGRLTRQRLNQLPKGLQPLLQKLKEGETLKPHRLGDWFVILSLHEWRPAPFSQDIQDQLLHDELNSWLGGAVEYLLDRLE